MSPEGRLAAVRAAEAARGAAMVAGDLESLAASLHPALRYGHTSGLWDTRDEYLAKLAEGSLAYPRMVSTVTGELVAGDQVLLWIDLDAEVITPAGRRTMHNACLTVWDVSGAAPLLLAHQPTVVA
jgi:hypothetical protein